MMKKTFSLFLLMIFSLAGSLTYSTLLKTGNMNSNIPVFAGSESGDYCHSVASLVATYYYDPNECGTLVASETWQYSCEGRRGGFCMEGYDFWQYDYVNCIMTEYEEVNCCQPSQCQ